jgi:hypothetical protein
MTTPERLTLLLPLANGDQLSVADQRSRIFRFLHRFEARGLRLPSGEQELWDAHEATATELKAVAEKVKRVFTTGFMFDGTPAPGTEGIGPDDVRLPLTFPSLRFAAFSPPPGRRRADRRFGLMIEAGRLRDLVPYLAMYLLTTEAVAIARCPAPRYRAWKERCDRFFIVGGHGRPSKTCSKKCATRVKAKRINEQRRREREAWKAALRKKQQVGSKRRGRDD